MQGTSCDAHLSFGAMPLAIRSQLPSATAPTAGLQRTQIAARWQTHFCFGSRSTAVRAASSRSRRAVLAVKASADRHSSTAYAQYAQQAAAGLAASSLAAAFLVTPADAAELQQLLPPPSHHSSSMQLASLPRAAVTELSIADVSLPHLNDLPSFNNPWQILGYLLKHPVAALLVGGGLAIAVPRLVRASVRFIVVPAALLLLAYLAARNPGFVWGGVSSTVSAVVAHPVATSAVILVGSSLLLSPYILLAGVAVVLVTGTKLLPGFLRPALPGPVSEALHQVDLLQGQTRSVFDQLTSAVRPAPALKDGRK